MNKVKAQGKTVEDAVMSALDQLQVSRDEVEIAVLEEPSKGFLGFGAKPALVEVERRSFGSGTESVPGNAESPENDQQGMVDLEEGVSGLERDEKEKHSAALDQQEEADPVQVGERFLTDMLEKMGVQAEIQTQVKEGWTWFELSGADMGKVIGRRGQTLDALQYLVNIVANRHATQRVRIMLDSENYRQRRKQSLQRLADRIAQKAIRTQQKVVLEPMNAAERKIIHTHLQHYAGVYTSSEGKEPNRCVTVHPHSRVERKQK